MLIICIGNPARGDDGIGPLVAEAIHQHPQTATLSVIEDFQLQPEMVEDLKHHAHVLIIDAQANATHPITLTRIEPQEDIGWCSHALSPAQLLGLYRQVYKDRTPEVVALGIAAQHFELGTSVDTLALNCVAPIIDCLINLTPKHLSPSKSLYDFLSAHLQAQVELQVTAHA